MADVSRDLDHLVVRETAAPEPYQYPGSPRDRTVPRSRDRDAHAAKLIAQLGAVAERVAARQQQPLEAGLVRGGGTYVTFESDPGDVLDIDRLEDRRVGFRVLAVKEEASGEGEPRVSAAVFVPEGKLDRLTQKVERYRTEDTSPDSGKPKNRRLVESVADITVSALSDLWTEWGTPFPDEDEELWWEAWLRADEDDEAEGVVAEFRAQAEAAGLTVSDREIVFPERIVLLIRGTARRLADSVFLLDTLAELRRARGTAGFFESLPPAEIAAWVRDAADRVSAPTGDAPAVCVFDTGVNRGHPLVEPALDESDMHAYGPEWSTADDLPSYPGGHGTEMAGLSLYGDLADALATPGAVRLEHRLESVRIIPPSGENKPELYGDITSDGVAQAELAAPERSRVCLLAVSADGRPYRGQPSSWSSAVDQLCYGADTDGRFKRLFVVAAGNASEEAVSAYPEGNETDTIHDPAQSWNALTVGAFTDRDQIDPSAHPGWTALAPRGGLSPSSTTSLVWDHRQTPHKPDVVMEGGNYGVNPDDGTYDYGHPPALRLLTTHRRLRTTPITTSGDTSGAAALAARLSARISARYPDLWPETVRALIVHSARWTDEMMEPYDSDALSKQGADADLNVLLRKYGYGVPDERDALRSASNSLTLIAQDALQPFVKGTSYNVKTNELNVHHFPWPTDVLQQLPSGVRAQMRVTLSYFVEPSPSSAGAAPIRTKFRYASHGLRFDAKTPLETVEQFRQRINKQARDDDQDGSPTSGDFGDWTLGKDLRTRGSVHSDWWEGSAAELAGKNAIAVYPVSGWWKERKHHGRWDRKVRYALVVTIRTPAVQTDIYTPVKNRVVVTI
jgi:hypothetical protein